MYRQSINVNHILVSLQKAVSGVFVRSREGKQRSKPRERLQPSHQETTGLVCRQIGGKLRLSQVCVCQFTSQNCFPTSYYISSPNLKCLYLTYTLHDNKIPELRRRDQHLLQVRCLLRCYQLQTYNVAPAIFATFQYL